MNSRLIGHRGHGGLNSSRGCGCRMARVGHASGIVIRGSPGLGTLPCLGYQMQGSALGGGRAHSGLQTLLVHTLG